MLLRAARFNTNVDRLTCIHAATDQITADESFLRLPRTKWVFQAPLALCVGRMNAGSLPALSIDLQLVQMSWYRSENR